MTVVDHTSKSREVAERSGKTKATIAPATPTGDSRKNIWTPPFQRQTQSYHVNIPTQGSSGCPDCGNNHQLTQCQTFKTKTQELRHGLAKQARLCYNCLKSGHGISACPSTSVRRVCAGKHHTLLHRPKPDSNRTNVSPQATTQVSTLHTKVNDITNTSQKPVLEK